MATLRNVLFLCTGNSARSVLAESLLNQLGKGRFKAYSAGSKPTGVPNPFAVELLASLGHDTGSIRSKSWDEFAGDDAPAMDYVITVCNNAAGEACPYWPGVPVGGHWGIPDPAGAGETDAENRAAFQLAFERMKTRVEAFLALDFDHSAPDALQQALANIGRSCEGAT